MRAWPNPVHGVATVTLRAIEPGAVRLEAFDVRGVRVTEQTASVPASGDAHIAWAPRRADGSRLSSGLYVLRARGGGHTMATRVLVAP